MTAFIVLIILVLLAIVILQIGRIIDISNKIRGEEASQLSSNKWNGYLSVIFMVLFLVGGVWSAWKYKNYYLWYGPHTSASALGGKIDTAFNITLFFTGIVFFITTFALFWYTYKYAGKKGSKASFIVDNHKLEILWTSVPAVVMTFLVINGLDTWNDVMADVKPNEKVIEIEATGVQFNWLLRYPGADGKLGTRDNHLITSSNPMGQDWHDPKNMDDFHPDEIVLPVNQKVRVRILARDVLHNFYLPHFRVKMDAIPGMPTYFVFTPTITSDQYKVRLSNTKEYQQLSDPSDPESKMRWQTFTYELACAELCGKGHFSMRRPVRIVTEEEYKKWLASQKSFYDANIKGTDADPFNGNVNTNAAASSKTAFMDSVDKMMKDTASKENTLNLDYVLFETGKATLKSESAIQLDYVAEIMQRYPTMKAEVAGHTDNVGNATSNLTLSKQRAAAVTAYLTNKGIAGSRLVPQGYGDTKPVADNGTDAGRAKNRRTEFKIIAK